MAFGLFVLLIGFRTDQRTGRRARGVDALRCAGNRGRRRFCRPACSGAGMAAAERSRSIAWCRPPRQDRRLGPRRYVGAAFLAFALAVPIIFYGNRYLLDLGHSHRHLHDARLGPEHRRRPRRPARSRLRRVLCGRRLFLRPDRAGFRPVFWVCLPLAGILAAFAGVMLGFPVLRLRGDYLAIVTLGFGEIIRLVLLNWQSLTGGPNGISGIPRPIVLRPAFHHRRKRLRRDLRADNIRRRTVSYSSTIVILALALLTNWVTLRLRRLPIGRAWEALREDEIACRALGINIDDDEAHRLCHRRHVRRLRRRLLRHAAGLHQPGDLHLHGERAWCWRSSCSAAWASQLGVALAATVMLGGFELFREFAQYRMLVFGAAMVADDDPAAARPGFAAHALGHVAANPSPRRAAVEPTRSAA